MIRGNVGVMMVSGIYEGMMANPSIIVGAFAGAMVYVLAVTEISRIAQAGYFVASLIIGIQEAQMTTEIIGYFIRIWTNEQVNVSPSIGATVAAASGVYILLLLRKLNIVEALNRLLSGDKNDRAK